MKLKLLSLFVLMATAFGVKAQWSELGGTNTSTFNNHISAIFIDGNGKIYAGGLFTNDTSYNKGYQYVAYWDGVSWNELGGSKTSFFNNYIYTLSSDTAGNLYAAGSFTNSLGNYYVAKWDRNSWNELGGANTSPFIGWIGSIKTDLSGNVLIGGQLSDSPIQNVGTFDGNNWSELGGSNTLGLNHWIYSITIDTGGNVYTGGYDYNSTNSKCLVYKWDKNNWSAVGGVNSSIFNLGIDPNPTIVSLVNDNKGNLYAAGSFKNTLGYNFVAKWDGTSWSELGGLNSSTFNYTILSLATDSLGNVYAGGLFKDAQNKEYVAKWNGTNWSKLGNTNFDGEILSIATDNQNNIYVGGSFLNANGKEYIAKYSATYLPVELIDFSVIKENKIQNISWQTASEINTSHFNIQRSNNGKDFTTIGKVNAKGASTYMFNDQALRPTPPSPKGVLYYRLEVVDKDGSKTYSEIRSVYLTTDDSGFTISPNPAKDYVTVTGSNIKQVKLLDNMGRVVVVKDVNNMPINIPVNRLSKGLYMVQATYTDGNMKTEKVVVE